MWVAVGEFWRRKGKNPSSVARLRRKNDASEADCVVPPAGLRDGKDFFPPPQTPFLLLLFFGRTKKKKKKNVDLLCRWECGWRWVNSGGVKEKIRLP